MKRHLLPLLIMSCFVITSISDCERETEERVILTINGKEYSIDKYYYLFDLEEDAYTVSEFRFERELYARNGETILLNFNMFEKDSIKLGSEMTGAFCESESEYYKAKKEDITSLFITLEFLGDSTIYRAYDGKAVLDGPATGTFEFQAKNENGEEVHVKNGFFNKVVSADKSSHGRFD